MRSRIASPSVRKVKHYTRSSSLAASSVPDTHPHLPLTQCHVPSLPSSPLSMNLLVSLTGRCEKMVQARALLLRRTRGTGKGSVVVRRRSASFLSVVGGRRG